MYSDESLGLGVYYDPSILITEVASSLNMTVVYVFAFNKDILTLGIISIHDRIKYHEFTLKILLEILEFLLTTFLIY